MSSFSQTQWTSCKRWNLEWAAPTGTQPCTVFGYKHFCGSTVLGTSESVGINRQIDWQLTYLRPSLPVEHRPSTTPRHRTLFWAALAIPDQLVTCCFSSTSVYCLQLLRGRPLFLFPCGLQVRAWCVVLDAGFLRVCPIQPHFLRSICLATGSCCVSLVSTRKEARWSAWFFSLLTVGNEGYVQQTNKQNWTLNSNEQKVLRSHSKYIKPKNVPERETTRMFLNS